MASYNLNNQFSDEEASQIRSFSESILKLIPDIDEGPVIRMFSLVLVKYAARPSTLYEISINDLDKYELLKNFIDEDEDLVQGWFATETKRMEWWIYNRKFSYMFEIPNVYKLPEIQRHDIRGQWLGFPCSGETFIRALETGAPVLTVDMRIDDNYFIGYYCKPSSEASHDSVSLWTRFLRFANVLNLNLTFSMYIGFA